MKTLVEDESAITGDQSAKKTTISFPIEIIHEIFYKLPAKSLFRFKSVSKSCLSLISDPKFPQLHFNDATVNHRTRLFISAYDSSNGKRHIFSGDRDGGLITHVTSLDGSGSLDITKAEHLNGLVCYSCVPWVYEKYHHHALVVNPSTHKIFTITNGFSKNEFHLFGFNESSNKLEILMMLKPRFGKTTVEVLIFSMSRVLWKLVNADPPEGFEWADILYTREHSVCVNSVVHLMVLDPLGVLAFDLRTLTFSMISTPQGVMPQEPSLMCLNGIPNLPRIVKINGCVGVFSYHKVEETDQMHIWILQDYKNRVWVREVITFPESWIGFGSSFPFSFDVDMDEVIFASSKVSGNEVSVPVYNTKSKCFKSLQFTVGDQFMSSGTLKFDQVKWYVDSMLPV